MKALAVQENIKAFDVQNIINGDAIGISLTGMLIVFSGLLFISIYIAILPKILAFLSKSDSKKMKKQGKKAEPATEEMVSVPIEKTNDTESYDIASVIGLVLQLEEERMSKVDNELITIVRDLHQPSMWGTAGKMRKIPRRRTHA